MVLVRAQIQDHLPSPPLKGKLQRGADPEQQSSSFVPQYPTKWKAGWPEKTIPLPKDATKQGTDGRDLGFAGEMEPKQENTSRVCTKQGFKGGTPELIEIQRGFVSPAFIGLLGNWNGAVKNGPGHLRFASGPEVLGASGAARADVLQMNEYPQHSWTPLQGGFKTRPTLPKPDLSSLKPELPFLKTDLSSPNPDLLPINYT